MAASGGGETVQPRGKRAAVDAAGGGETAELQPRGKRAAVDAAGGGETAEQALQRQLAAKDAQLAALAAQLDAARAQLAAAQRLSSEFVLGPRALTTATPSSTEGFEADVACLVASYLPREGWVAVRSTGGQKGRACVLGVFHSPFLARLAVRKDFGSCDLGDAEYGPEGLDWSRFLDYDSLDNWTLTHAIGCCASERRRGSRCWRGGGRGRG
jgi:hypothetical protein